MATLLVMMAMAPLTTYCMPSVEMNTGRLLLMARRPLIRPIKAPASRPRRSEKTRGMSAFSAMAQMMPPKLVTAPTERSMPCEASRNVSGMATMKLKLAVRSMSSRFLRTKKAGLTKATTISSSASGSSAPSSLRLKSNRYTYRPFAFSLFMSLFLPFVQRIARNLYIQMPSPERKKQRACCASHPKGGHRQSAMPPRSSRC